VLEAARTGPISPELLDDALTMLGLDADRAATTLGAGSAGIVLAWRTGALPIPTFVAAHVRSLIACHDRHG
jgi:hypothetical protein